MRKKEGSTLSGTGENNFDELWVNNSGHNEGTTCLINE